MALLHLENQSIFGLNTLRTPSCTSYWSHFYWKGENVHHSLLFVALCGHRPAFVHRQMHLQWTCEHQDLTTSDWRCKQGNHSLLGMQSQCYRCLVCFSLSSSCFTSSWYLWVLRAKLVPPIEWSCFVWPPHFSLPTMRWRLSWSRRCQWLLTSPVLICQCKHHCLSHPLTWAFSLMTCLPQHTGTYQGCLSGLLTDMPRIHANRSRVCLLIVVRCFWPLKKLNLWQT